MFGLLFLAIVVWLLGALLDAAVRARNELSAASEETAFSLVWKALVWPAKRPWDVLRAAYNGISGGTR